MKRAELKRWCYREYNRALATGTLVRPERCTKCGRKGRIDGHHEEHEKPLDVMWLCQPCHCRRHGKLNTGTNRRPVCVRCDRVIFRHLLDSGSVEMVGDSAAHIDCANAFRATGYRRMGVAPPKNAHVFGAPAQARPRLARGIKRGVAAREKKIARLERLRFKYLQKDAAHNAA